jgi:hypothetical protein
MFRAEREEFSAIAMSPNYEDERTKHVLVDEAWVTVVKPYMGTSKTRKWEFIYEGGKITAPITDDDFMSAIDRIEFYVGMKMKVAMDIKQVYFDRYNTFLNKDYVILRVLDIPSRPLQSEISF